MELVGYRRRPAAAGVELSHQSTSHINMHNTNEKNNNNKNTNTRKNQTGTGHQVSEDEQQAGVGGRLDIRAWPSVGGQIVRSAPRPCLVR